MVNPLFGDTVNLKYNFNSFLETNSSAGVFIFSLLLLARLLWGGCRSGWGSVWVSREGWGPSAVPLWGWGEHCALPQWLGRLVRVLCTKNSVLCLMCDPPHIPQELQAAVPRGHSSAPQLCQCPLGLLEEITEKCRKKSYCALIISVVLPTCFYLKLVWKPALGALTLLGVQEGWDGG